MLGFGALAAQPGCLERRAGYYFPPVTDEGSTSSFSTRFLLIAQVVVNSGNAKRPLTADSTSKCRRTFPPVTSHVRMHEVGADRPDFEQRPRSGGSITSPLLGTIVRTLS